MKIWQLKTKTGRIFCHIAILKKRQPVWQCCRSGSFWERKAESGSRSGSASNWKAGSGSELKWKGGSHRGSFWSIRGSKSGGKWVVDLDPDQSEVRIRICIKFKIKTRIRNTAVWEHQILKAVKNVEKASVTRLSKCTSVFVPHSWRVLVPRTSPAPGRTPGRPHTA